MKLVTKCALKTKANFVVTGASAGAVKEVEKAGGKVEILPAKVNKLLKGKLPKKARDQKTEAKK